jgi:hypothetical protein
MAMEVAESMLLLYGPRSSTADGYLNAVSYASPAHLISLRRRGCAILMAPTVPLALCSEAADLRRGYPLDPRERKRVDREYGDGSGVLAIYDWTIKALVLPTSEGHLDTEHIILHELGHALTLDQIGTERREDLFSGLPARIAAFIEQSIYSTHKSKVAEIMAEAYVWTVVGRGEELPPAVISELVGILPNDVEPPLENFF